MRRNVWLKAALTMAFSLAMAACDSGEQDGAPGPTLPPLSTESVLPTAGGTPDQPAPTEAATGTPAQTASPAPATGTALETVTADATRTPGVTATSGPDASPTPAVNAAALIDRGEDVYLNNCSTCHRPGGEGSAGTFPALAGNALVTAEDPGPVIQQVVQGGGGMPPFGPQLSDREIAAVVSYIRNAWGNDASVVPPEQVSAGQAAD